MSSLSTSQVLIGAFALIALFLNIQWLFLAMLLLFGALFAAESLQEQPHRLSHPGKLGTSHGRKPPGFMDNLIANLITSEYEVNRKKEEEEREEKAKERREKR